jgi:GT2 family glycosyltransferase
MGDVRSRLGVVAIGRNEGERLKRCLASVSPDVPLVYVDSGSSDGSVEYARGRGAEVVELDMTRPFTAARARNEGLERLGFFHPSVEFVQFLDGDCEVEAGWFDTAIAALDKDRAAAAVCGRRRERFPEASFYNRLCDEEWDTPVGEAIACGGDATMRVKALQSVEGYDPVIIAGEEPELCHRLRAAGWHIYRLNAPMTIHDANMHSIRQWWLRAVRSGFGYAQVWRKTASSGGNSLYGAELGRAFFWAIGVPMLGGALAAIFSPLWLLTIPALWFMQIARLAIRSGLRKATLLLVGKLAEALGAIRFVLTAVGGRRPGAIYYK